MFENTGVLYHTRLLLELKAVAFNVGLSYRLFIDGGS